MPQRSSRSRARSILRGAGVVVAFALAALAVWLIAMGSSLKEVRLGMLAGFWALLVGSFAIFGVRQAQADEPASSAGSELELREEHAVELQRDVAERRLYEQQLQAMVERELGKIQSAMTEQLIELRSEVASLRTDMLENVGAQVGLERIETTRLFGSDLEALQQEVRRLGLTSESVSGRTLVDSPAAIDSAGPASDSTEPMPVIDPTSSTSAAQHRSFQTVPPAPAVAVPPAASSVAVPPAPAVVERAEPAHASRDPFAGLPRLTRFAETELDPLPPASTVTRTREPVPAATQTTSSAPATAVDLASGRRHAAEESADQPDPASSGGGRRRRADGESNEVLDRLLGTV